MKDLMGMMKQAKEMQARMGTLQEEIAAMEVTGQAGAGMVSVTLTGKGEMKGVEIDPSLMKEDEKDICEDLVMAAHNDAKTKLDVAIQEKTQALTAGMNLPEGMKLPF